MTANTMVVATDDISRKEHLLAEKAQGILEHQQQLQALQLQKEKLQHEKPTVEKQQLSYEESLQFGKRISEYKEKLQRIEVQIQKLRRELCALKKQAKKLLPVSNVKIKVSMHSDSDVPNQSYCITHIEKEGDNKAEEHFDIEQL
jgi:chromosome segregation ATPase